LQTHEFHVVSAQRVGADLLEGRPIGRETDIIEKFEVENPGRQLGSKTILLSQDDDEQTKCSQGPYANKD